MTTFGRVFAPDRCHYNVQASVIEKGKARSLIAEKLGVARSTLFMSLRRAEVESALLPRRRPHGKKRLHNR
jgi:transposase-like protein